MTLQSSSDPAGGARPRALVIDDHAISVTLMSLMLDRMGFAAIGARSAAEGRALAAEGDFVLIIIDALLGPDSGVALAEELAARTSAAVVITSGLEAPALLPPGVSGWLAKPYSPRMLHTVIRRAGAAAAGTLAG